MATSRYPPDMGDVARANNALEFLQALAEHSRRPFLLPLHILGAFIIPTLWLAIPHVNRPWLYQTRWLVLAFIVLFHLDIVAHVSSANVAFGYGAGLMASWGTCMALHLLVWTRPQFDFARVVKVEQQPVEQHGHQDDQHPYQASCDPSSDKETLHNDAKENGLRHRAGPNGRNENYQNTPPPNNKADGLVWQRFPAHAPFSQRLNWSFDLMTSFRGLGWNTTITCVPRPRIPQQIRSGDPVSLDGIPVVSRHGYRRNLTESEFVWTRLRTAAIMYMILDFLAVYMVKDPYFVYGPGYDRGLLPDYLKPLSHRVLLVYRQLFTLFGVYAAVAGVFSLHDLFQFYVFSHMFPARGELWQYTTVNGSFAQIFDRGLAGWWGSWWHQTFRQQFSAPVTYLVENGYLARKSLAAQLLFMVVAFFQSGLLHAAGSISSLPTDTQAWRAPVFFLLQPVGIIIQILLAHALEPHLQRVPRILKQTANLCSSFLWLHLTAGMLTDDLASTRLWLLEPIPVSPLRWWGFGHPNDHWWRWNSDFLPSAYSGGPWWAKGLQC